MEFVYNNVMINLNLFKLKRKIKKYQFNFETMVSSVRGVNELKILV